MNKLYDIICVIWLINIYFVDINNKGFIFIIRFKLVVIMIM